LQSQTVSRIKLCKTLSSIKGIYSKNIGEIDTLTLLLLFEPLLALMLLLEEVRALLRFDEEEQIFPQAALAPPRTSTLSRTHSIYYLNACTL